MTVSRALIELKTLDKRINDKVRSTTFCMTNKHSNAQIKGKDISVVQQDIKSQYQSIMALIRRRAAIKAAVVLSNATTKVKINGQSYTVAEAIEMKNHGVSYQEELVKAMLSQYSDALDRLNMNNGDRLQRAAESYITSLYGSKDKMNNSKEVQADLDKYLENNKLDIINPLDIETLADKHRDEIDAFMDEVDSAITISNATQTIEVEYEAENSDTPKATAKSPK